MLQSPGEEARLANKQLLSRVMANHLVLEVLGTAGQLAGLARLPTSSLHKGLAAGRPDSLLVAAEGLVEMVQEGKMVGLLQVGLLAGTLEQFEEVGEEDWGGQRDNDLQ